MYLMGDDLVELEKKDWSRIAPLFSDYTFEQSYEYVCWRAQLAGEKPRFFAVYADGELVGAAAVRLKIIPVLGRGVAYVSSGPMAQRQGAYHRGFAFAANALRRRLVEVERHFLFIRLPLLDCPIELVVPEILKAGFRATHRVRSYRTITVDITQSEATLRARLSGKWRTDLKYAEKCGLVLESGSGKEITNRFLAIFDSMSRTKDFEIQVNPRDFFEVPSDKVGQTILIASRGGEDVGGHVLSLLGNTAIYLFGATNELGRNAKAGYFLNWEAIRLAKKSGCARYDLGGVDPNTNPTGYRFKSRMGGTEVFAAGPFEATPSGVVGNVGDWLLSLREYLKPRVN